MPFNKLLRILCYTVTLAISLILAVILFTDIFFSSGFTKELAVTLYQKFPDSKFLQMLGQTVAWVLGPTTAGFLFFVTFFRSGFSRWLKNTLLRIFPVPK